MAKSVAIVGAGPGGLACAMLLSHAGLNVDLYDRRPVVGGRAASVKAKGFTFDPGPNFLFYPQILEQVFKSCGFELHRKVSMVKLDPMYKVQFGTSGSIECTSDISEMARRVRKLSSRDSDSFVHWINDSREKFFKVQPLFQQACEDNGWQARLKKLGARRIAKAGGTIMDEMEHAFHDPRLRALFCGSPRLTGLSPYHAPPVHAIAGFQEYEQGLWYPMGGVGGVCEIMASIIEQAGANIHLSQPVSEIAFSARSAVGVVTGDNERHKADAVVLGADFSRFMLKRVSYHLRPSWPTDDLREAEHSCSHFVLLIGVSGKRDDLPHCTLYYPHDFERTMAEMGEKHTYSDQPMFLLQNPCITDDTLAPRGMSTLVVQVPVSHRAPRMNWEHKRKLYRDLIIRNLSHIGIRKMPGKVVYHNVITPFDWEKECRHHLGASFGLAATREQMLEKRPNNRFEDIDRLYLVGASTHPGINLPGVFESARITARLILQDFGMSTAKLDAPLMAARPML